MKVNNIDYTLFAKVLPVLHGEILSLGYFVLLDSKPQEFQITKILTVYLHHNLLLRWLEVCCLTLRIIPSSQACSLTNSYWIISNWFSSLCTTFLPLSQFLKRYVQRNQRREYDQDTSLPYLSAFSSHSPRKQVDFECLKNSACELCYKKNHPILLLPFFSFKPHLTIFGMLSFFLSAQNESSHWHSNVTLLTITLQFS